MRGVILLMLQWDRRGVALEPRRAAARGDIPSRSRIDKLQPFSSIKRIVKLCVAVCDGARAGESEGPGGGRGTIFYSERRTPRMRGRLCLRVVRESRRGREGASFWGRIDM